METAIATDEKESPIHAILKPCGCISYVAANLPSAFKGLAEIIEERVFNGDCSYRLIEASEKSGWRMKCPEHRHNGG